MMNSNLAKIKSNLKDNTFFLFCSLFQNFFQLLLTRRLWKKVHLKMSLKIVHLNFGKCTMFYKYCRLQFFPCKIGDFIIAGFVCLKKRVCLPFPLRPIFSDFFNYALKTKQMSVNILHSVSDNSFLLLFSFQINLLFTKIN